MKNCKKCAHSNDDEVKFCVMCGEKFEIHSATNQVANSGIKECTKCGYLNDADMKFCVTCGNPLIKKEISVPQIQKPKPPIEKPIKTEIQKRPTQQEIVGAEPTKSEKQRKGLHPLFYIALLAPIVLGILWSLVQGILEKECDIVSDNLICHEFGGKISYVVRTDVDWLKQDMIEVNVHDSHVEWQHNDGKYYSNYDGVKLPKDIDLYHHRLAHHRFENDSTIVIDIDHNRGYNRKFDINISVRGEQGLESISHSETFTIYQEGIMGKGDFEVMPKQEEKLVEYNNEL